MGGRGSRKGWKTRGRDVNEIKVGMAKKKDVSVGREGTRLQRKN